MWELFWVLIYSGIFTIIIKKIPFYKLDGIPAYFILSAFYIKVLAGYLLFLIYTRYYPDRHTADIFKFFDDSKIMYDTLFTRPLDYFQMLFGIRNDNAHFNEYYHQMNNWCGIYPTNIYGDGHIMIRFNAVLRLVSFGYYNVHSVVLNFLSFSGLIGFFRFVRPYLKGVQKELFFLLFLFPSVVFWGSGVLKEGLIFFSTGLFLFTMERMIRKGFSLRLLAGLIFTLLVIRYCKFYLFAFLLPLSLSYWWCSRTGDRFSFRKYLSVIIVFILLGFLAKYVNPVYDMLSLLSHKQQDFLQLARDAGSGSLMDLPS
ncbi:MAG: hypothetical protein NTU44_08660 [Bacteroidetes bacterium]|nr:hypothetical protein [Bacteroidota bacterium]